MSHISKEESRKDSPDYLFSDINEVFEHLRNMGWNQIDTFAYAASMFRVMMINDTWGAYFPMPMNPLFRGQRLYHDVCKPSFYRREWNEQENLERLLQIEDFKHMLDVNPEVESLKKANLYVNYIGLAQHYGIETDMLDMTNSPLVAAFFATTEYDSLTDTYKPVEDCISVGCIYFYALGANFNGFSGNEDGVWPVGMEALRRPSEQRGYTIRMKENDNFNTMINHPTCFRFIQNRDWSYRIFTATRGGNLLFPYDPMAEKIRIMRKYRIYGVDSLMAVMDHINIQQTLEEVKASMEQFGCHFLPSTPFGYTETELSFVEKEYNRRFPNG
jgi:hypothetical protein